MKEIRTNLTLNRTPLNIVSHNMTYTLLMLCVYFVIWRCVAELMHMNYVTQLNVHKLTNLKSKNNHMINAWSHQIILVCNDWIACFILGLMYIVLITSSHII